MRLFLIGSMRQSNGNVWQQTEWLPHLITMGLLPQTANDDDRARETSQG
jgi:hypothetical protein